ncbi:hypothetical protein KGP36_01845 [Patescibacteria group bacterium]|nr:hypothetical protein [Patescibacteria group bacterium]
MTKTFCDICNAETNRTLEMCENHAYFPPEWAGTAQSIQINMQFSYRGPKLDTANKKNVNVCDNCINKAMLSISEGAKELIQQSPTEEQ